MGCIASTSTATSSEIQRREAYADAPATGGKKKHKKQLADDLITFTCRENRMYSEAAAGQASLESLRVPKSTTLPGAVSAGDPDSIELVTTTPLLIALVGGSPACSFIGTAAIRPLPFDGIANASHASTLPADYLSETYSLIEGDEAFLPLWASRYIDAQASD